MSSTFKHFNAPYMGPCLAYINQWLTTQVSLDWQTPGYAIAITHHGTVIYNQALGYANREHEEKLTNRHLFRTASHSKTFTALAIMQLMEKGDLSIYEPASAYLPFLKKNPDTRVASMTIQHILQHASGISRDGKDPSFWQLHQAFPKKEEMIAFFENEPLVIETNTRFKYSNYAYGLLGLIIEKVAKCSYASYMAAHVLRPLGLEYLVPEYCQNNGSYVTGYTALVPNGTQAPMSPAVHTHGLVGATGFCANAESLCLFYDAMLPKSGKLLCDSLKREMWRQQWTIPDESAMRGYGLGVTCEHIENRHLKGQSGGMLGHMTRTLCDLDDRFVVSVLSNSCFGAPALIQKGIWHILDTFKAHYDPSSPFLKYQGKFYDMYGAVHFVALGDKIYVTTPSAMHPFKNCSVLAHEKDDTFKIIKETGYGSYGEHVRFVMDEDTVKFVNYAGYTKMNASDNARYNQTLSDDAVNMQSP